ncbi:two pore channel protein 2-like [Salvelinus fontinalis]|uniref:two pore channel protein 2-like n=1 Tax=Salvelinus fontinalis TaxID=8038 RepID=UPI002486B861|nr:two pore channel protein 2-like [Salvelinus fontinalis]
MMESFPLLPGGVHSGSANYRAPKEISLHTEEELYIQQAVVLNEDAVHYRSLNRHMNPRSIGLYRWYYSRLCQWGLNVVKCVILALAFIERPSSLSVTSGLRSKHTLWEPPCGLTEGIEIICLLILTFHLIVKVIYTPNLLLIKASQSSSGCIPREAFQRLFDELDKDRIKQHPPLPEYSSKFLHKVQYIFSQHYVTVVGNAVSLANVVCICVIILLIEMLYRISERDNYYLETINCFFILYYLLEMVLKVVAFGWTGYMSYGSNVFDGSLTVLSLGLQISIFATYSLTFSYW